VATITIISLTFTPISMSDNGRVQNSSRLPATAGTLATLAGDFSPKKYKKCHPIP